MSDLRSALLIVDVQNDFITGSLAVHNARAVIPVINRIAEEFDFSVVVASLDWHPPNHLSFYDNRNNLEYVNLTRLDLLNEASLFDEVLFEGNIKMKLWPVHCVQNTEGAQIYPDLQVSKPVMKFYKGTKRCEDGYSATHATNENGTNLITFLTELNIRRIFICGLALDYCVKETACEFAKFKHLSIIVIKDATRPVNNDPTFEQDLLNILNGSGVRVILSEEISSIFNKTK